MINWPGNDFYASGLLSNDPEQQADALLQGKLTSLWFVYWLQQEAPRDHGTGPGYRDLALANDSLGSSDGLSQFPYIRESRRICALTTIREQQISALFQNGARATLFPDSVGIGLYPIDIHSCLHQDFGSEAKPFQIPSGALIRRELDNLLAASKNIGTTHITNGAYRLHPVEWAIGEAAAHTALLALETGQTPAQIDHAPCLLEKLQKKLGRKRSADLLV
jgi:hypothetical protein